MAKSDKAPGEKITYFVGVAAWLVPGAGHWFLGQRYRALILFLAITSTFGLGVLLGSIEMIDPKNSRAWFCAEILVGGPTILTAWRQSPAIPSTEVYGRQVDLGHVYAGVAGLLNLLCILDVLVQCQPSTQPLRTGPQDQKNKPAQIKVDS